MQNILHGSAGSSVWATWLVFLELRILHVNLLSRVLVHLGQAPDLKFVEFDPIFVGTLVKAYSNELDNYLLKEVECPAHEQGD